MFFPLSSMLRYKKRPTLCHKAGRSFILITEPSSS
jgi:hypothetical protein